MQLTHQGTVLNLAIAENATIAMTYDAKIRTYAHELSKFRSRGKEIINLLKEDDQRIKRETVRECGTTSTFVPRDGHLRKDPRGNRRQDKGGKGNKGGGKGNGKGNRRQRRGGWQPTSDRNNDNWNRRPSNDGNARPTNNANAADSSQQTTAAAPADNAQAEKPSKQKQKKQRC